MDEEISSLARQIEPRAEVILAKCLQSLLTAGFIFPASVDADKAVEVYGFAIDGLPAAALRRVTEKLIRGEIAGHHDFLPKPPALAAMVREHASVMRSDLRRAKEMRATLAEGRERTSRPEPTEEAKARVRALVQSVTRTLAVSDSEASEEGRHVG